MELKVQDVEVSTNSTKVSSWNNFKQTKAWIYSFRNPILFMDVKTTKFWITRKEILKKEEVVLMEIILKKQFLPIQTGEDQIGTDLKNLLVPKFLKQRFPIPIVDLYMEDGSWLESIQNPLEQLLMLKFVLVESFLDVPVQFPSKSIIVDHTMFIIWMIHLQGIQDTVQFDTPWDEVIGKK